MASPMRNKVSIGKETTYGTAQVGSGVVAYQTTSDGSPTPITTPVTSDGIYYGRQAPLDEAIFQVLKGFDMSLSKYAKSVGDELWFDAIVGNTVSTPGTAIAASNPVLRPKTYYTDDIGPTDSYTIVLDRFTLNAAGASDLTRSTLVGCMAKSWGLSVSVDGAVETNADFVVRQLTDATGQSTGLTSAYPTATGKRPHTFNWQDCSLAIGPAGTAVGSLTPFGFVRSFSYSQDNRLEVDRYYLSGDALMSKPYSMGPITGSVDIEADFSDATNTNVWQRFTASTQVALSFTAAVGAAPNENSLRLYLPSVFLESASVSAGLEGATTLTATGNLRWRPATRAVQVDYTTEGNTNP